MPSQIDETQPVFGTPTTQSVRQNFAVAKTEISALQILTNGGPFLSINGGTLRGPLTLPNAPITGPLQAATKNYVDQTVASEAIWRGIYLVAANNPDLTLAADHQNGYSWTCVTANPQVPEQLIVPLPPLAAGTTIYNGDSLRYSTVEGGWDIIKGSALTVEIGEALFVPITGGTMTGPLILASSPTSNQAAATKLYVDSVRVATTPAAIGAVPIAGGTMTGLLILSGAPTGPSGATTKQYVDAGISTAIAPLAPLASPVFTGAPVAPTQASSDNSTRLATTAFVRSFAAPLVSPAFSGVPTAPSAGVGNASAQIATTGFVANGFLPIQGGVLSGGLTVNGPILANNALTVGGLLTAATLTVNGGTTLNVLTVNGAVAAHSTLAVDGLITAYSGLTASSINVNANAGIAGELYVTGGVHVGGALAAGGTLYAGTITSGGANSGFYFVERSNPSTSWLWYASGGLANLYCSLTGVNALAVNQTTSAVTLASTYLYLGGSSGTVNGAGGPFLYGDNASIALHLGPGGGNFLVQNGAGRTLFGIDPSGGVHGLDFHPVISSDGTYTTIMDGDGSGSIFIGGSAPAANTTFYRNTTHRFQTVGGGSDYVGIDWSGMHVSIDMAIRQIYPFADNSFVCGYGSAAWSSVGSYAYYTSSDIRVKEDIEALPDCLDLVRTITPQRYKFNNAPDADRDRVHWGFMAQDVAAAMQDAGHDFGGHQIADDEAQSQSLAYNDLVAVLWKACQELADRLATVEGRLA
jgi:cytoskeletal protein CcmA (bactofilin family)